MPVDRRLEPFGRQLVILAAERTLLGWLRLCLTLMSLGFVLDRFGIYIRMQGVLTEVAWLPRPFTLWVGAGLVMAGAATAIAAGGIYARFRRGYAHLGYAGPEGSGFLSVLLAAAVALVGIVTTIFLFMIPG